MREYKVGDRVMLEGVIAQDSGAILLMSFDGAPQGMLHGVAVEVMAHATPIEPAVTDVEYIRADIHDAQINALKAENAALHAECDRLTALIQMPHDSTPAIERAWNRFNEAISDGPDAPYPCMASAFESYYGQKWNDKSWRRETSVWAAAWKESANHLTAMLGPQDVLKAEDVTEPGFYQWRHLDGEQWTITEVVVNEAPELRQYYFGSEEDLELIGQFIGPIRMPEVSNA